MAPLGSAVSAGADATAGDGNGGEAGGDPPPPPPPPEHLLLVATRMALEEAGRPLTAGELFEALPKRHRTSSPVTLGRALADLGWASVRQRIDGRQARVYILNREVDDPSHDLSQLVGDSSSDSR